jgi:hypothetical protein
MPLLEEIPTPGGGYSMPRMPATGSKTTTPNAAFLSEATRISWWQTND